MNYNDIRNKYIHLKDKTPCYYEGCTNKSVYVQARFDDKENFKFSTAECQDHRNEDCDDNPCSCTDFLISKEMNGGVMLYPRDQYKPQFIVRVNNVD